MGDWDEYSDTTCRQQAFGFDTNKINCFNSFRIFINRHYNLTSVNKINYIDYSKLVLFLDYIKVKSR